MTTRDIEEQVVRRQRAPTRARPRLLGELAIICALVMADDRVRSLAAVRSAVAVSHGWAILDMESVLHLRIERALNSWLTQQGFMRVMAVDYYQYLHVSVALAVLVVCYVRRPAAYRPARNALVLTNVVALAVFAAYPVAPPRLLPGAGFVDSVAAAGFGSSHGVSPGSASNRHPRRTRRRGESSRLDRPSPRRPDGQRQPEQDQPEADQQLVERRDGADRGSSSVEGTARRRARR